MKMLLNKRNKNQPENTKTQNLIDFQFSCLIWWKTCIFATFRRILCTLYTWSLRYIDETLYNDTFHVYDYNGLKTGGKGQIGNDKMYPNEYI